MSLNVISGGIYIRIECFFFSFEIDEACFQFHFVQWSNALTQKYQNVSIDREKDHSQWQRLFIDNFKREGSKSVGVEKEVEEK